MKSQIEQTLTLALKKIIEEKTLGEVNALPIIHLERPKQITHGDYSSNIAMVLAKEAGCAPRILAEKIIAALPATSYIEKIEIAGPGFINFYLVPGAEQEVIAAILQKGENFGRHKLEKPASVNVEFVSANPTGPLHVGHGRGAAYGSGLARLLAFAGSTVTTEYYVNDAGRQMDILAVSVWLRYLSLFQQAFTFPKNGYKGEYVIDIAERLKTHYQDKFLCPVALIFEAVSPDEGVEGGDKEKHIDDLIAKAKQLLKNNYSLVHEFGLKIVLEGIEEDLKDFAVTYNRWFSEKKLHDSGALSDAIEQLTQKGWVYENQGAKWFKSQALGDDKDRVLVRENGQPTYFAADAAYLLDKVNRGYDKIIYVFGADHHGYVPRLKALAAALGIDEDKIVVPLVQFAVLYQGGKQVQMSTRSGSFITLRELMQEVGSDAARYFYLMRKPEQHLDFDLDLAKSQSNDNPVYYIQYAHARICSVFKQLNQKGWPYEEKVGLKHLNLLSTSHEQAIIKTLSQFEELVRNAADKLEPHLIAYYLKDLAGELHTYYNSQQFLVAEPTLRQARLCLIAAVKIVLGNGLAILGLSAPEEM